MTSVQEYYDQQWDSDDYVFTAAFKEAIGYSYALLGELKGKKILEIGGGSGEQAIHFSSQGAEITVIDLSPKSIQEIKTRAEKKGMKINALPMNAEQLEFPAESFDLIYINSTLMHVEQQKVLQECSRVLRKEGKLAIIEPMKYAPFVQLYRLFGSYRKMKPKYATFRMFTEGKKYFSNFEHQEFYLFASLLLPVFYVKNSFLHRMYRRVAVFDAALIKIFPFLRYGCWVGVVEYRK